VPCLAELAPQQRWLRMCLGASSVAASLLDSVAMEVVPGRGQHCPTCEEEDEMSAALDMYTQGRPSRGWREGHLHRDSAAMAIKGMRVLQHLPLSLPGPFPIDGHGRWSVWCGMQTIQTAVNKAWSSPSTAPFSWGGKQLISDPAQSE
jgi:hypothetical protein